MFSVLDFLASSLPVRQNAVKSILFRTAALLLQFSIYKFSCFVAYRQNEYTAYLMFAEDIVQQLYFVAARKCNRSGMLVLSLAVLLLLGGLYDTLLWALDSPGYVAIKHPALATAKDLLDHPSYIVNYRSRPGVYGYLESNLPEIMGENLFKPGLGSNLSLTETVNHGTRRTVARPADRTLAETGPRIWLDEEGFSVSADSYVTIHPSDMNAYCPQNAVKGTNMLAWSCMYPNNDSLAFLEDYVGRPEIFYDSGSEALMQSVYLTADREDNIWTSLGKGGGTAFMSQVFTVTKGKERHTFALMAFKATMVAPYDSPFLDAEITDLVKRTYSAEPADWETEAAQADITVISGKIIASQANNTSYMLGTKIGVDNYTIFQSHYQLMNVVGELSGTLLYSALRISTVNITLIRSDTLAADVAPFSPCSGKYFQNESKGGRTVITNCHKSIGNQTNARFLGQVDNSATFIISGTLGDGSSNISAIALSQKPWHWANKKLDHISNFLLSRGFILGLDPTLVTIESSILKPAISWLQILLIVIPAVLAAAAWLLLCVSAVDHYSSSLLQSLVSTTDARGRGQADRLKSSRSPAYMFHVPDIHLMQESHPTPGAVVLGNQGGVFRYAPWSYASEGGAGQEWGLRERGQYGVQQAVGEGVGQPLIQDEGMWKDKR